MEPATNEAKPAAPKSACAKWKLMASALCGAAIMYCFHGQPATPPDLSLGVKPGDAYVFTVAGGTNSNPFVTLVEPWLVSVFDVEEVRGGFARGMIHLMRRDGLNLRSDHNEVRSCSSLKSTFTKIE